MEIAKLATQIAAEVELKQVEVPPISQDDPKKKEKDVAMPTTKRQSIKTLAAKAKAKAPTLVASSIDRSSPATTPSKPKALAMIAKRKLQIDELPKFEKSPSLLATRKGKPPFSHEERIEITP